MREPGDAAANAELDLRPQPKSRRGAFIQVAPGPELPDERDKAGAQGGMVLVLILGGVFWAVVGAAAIYFLRR